MHKKIEQAGMALSLSFKYLIQLTILKEICHACVAIYSAKLYVTKKTRLETEY